MNYEAIAREILHALNGFAPRAQGQSEVDRVVAVLKQLVDRKDAE